MDLTQPPTALITGASRGLGCSLARELARRGWSLALMARRRPLLEAAAEQIRLAGEGKAEVVCEAGDVADEAARVRLTNRVAERWGHLHLLVNNASELGPTPLPRLEEFPIDALERLFQANTVAPLRLVQLSVRLLQAAGHAMVLNITSDAAVAGYPGWGGYGASKAALELISRALANELAGTGVRVLAVDPGDMDTDMHRLAVPDADPRELSSPDEVARRIASLIERYLGADRSLDAAWRISLAPPVGGDARA